MVPTYIFLVFYSKLSDFFILGTILLSRNVAGRLRGCQNQFKSMLSEFFRLVVET